MRLYGVTLPGSRPRGREHQLPSRGNVGRRASRAGPPTFGGGGRWLQAIRTIAYEALRDDYENVMASVCGLLGCSGGSFPKPDRENYVKAPGAATHVVNDEDRMLLEAWIDQQMPADLFAK